MGGQGRRMFGCLGEGCALSEVLGTGVGWSGQGSVKNSLGVQERGEKERAEECFQIYSEGPN